MATFQILIDIARRHLVETTASFWSDAELLVHAQDGIRDLKRAIDEKAEDYFLMLADVTMGASDDTLNNVPATCGIIRSLNPKVPAKYPTMHFFPRRWNHPDFQGARAQAAIDPANGGSFYYCPVGAGGPVGAPTIYVAPTVSAAVTLELGFLPALAAADMELGDPVPAPGECDHAIVAWIVSHARAKEREDRKPDPEWLAIYATDKLNILNGLEERQEDEPEYVEGMFEEYN